MGDDRPDVPKPDDLGDKGERAGRDVLARHPMTSADSLPPAADHGVPVPEEEDLKPAPGSRWSCPLPAELPPESMVVTTCTELWE